MKKQLGHVDLETGEVLQGIPFWVGVKSAPYGNRWFMANQDALIAIASVCIQQAEIAETLNMQRPHVSRAIRILERKGILLRGHKLGKSYGYRLNPYYGWKGKSNKLQNARLELVKG